VRITDVVTKSARERFLITIQKRTVSSFLFCFFLLFFICFCGGCRGTFWGHTFELFRPEVEPNDVAIKSGYDRVLLRKSSSADVLSVLSLPDYELLSQSSSVIASTGQKKKGYKNWLKMVAFDEDELTARRKYFLMVDERPRFLFVEPWADLRFNSEMLIGRDVLDEPYSSENARRIAVLKRVIENTHRDIGEVSQDSQTANVCGMLINQALESVLVKLESSNVLASRLDEPEGLSFEHINLDRGKIMMFIRGDFVNVDVKLGSILKKRLEWTGRRLKYRRPGQ